MALRQCGDYEIDLDNILGQGGMGTVYMGRQVSLDRPVAVKILSPELSRNGEFVERFRRESAILARLVHSNIVQIYGAGEVDNQHFFAMEYVEGEDLAARLRRGVSFTTHEVTQVAWQTARALGAAW